LAELKASADRILLGKAHIFVVIYDAEGNVRVSAVKRAGNDKDDFLKSARAF
jgi:hypothetical protein